MSKRDRNRGGSRIPRPPRSGYLNCLHRRPARWDVLVWELSLTLGKRCAARRGLFAAAGLPLADSGIAGVSLMLARGFELAFARELRRDPDLARAVDQGNLDEPRASRLAPLLAGEFYEPLLRKYAEDSADRYLPRPNPPLEQLAAQLAAVTMELLLTRCAPEGDLRQSLAAPADDAADYFPDSAEPADPPAGSGRPSTDILRLQINVQETDDAAATKEKLLHFALHSPWTGAEMARYIASNADEQGDLSDRLASRIDRTEEFLISPTRLQGKTPAELLIEQQPDMPEAQRRRLLRWSDESFVGLFQLQSVEGSFSLLKDVRDDRAYRAWASRSDALRSIRRDSLVFTRLLPWDEHWIISGIQRTFGQVKDRDLAEIRDQMPIVSRCTAPRAGEDDPMEQKARKLQLEHYQAWLKLYGSDELLFDDGHKLRNAVEEFYHHWTYHVVNSENGLTPAQSYERQHGGSPPRLSVPMPQHLLESDDVAALMDPLGGLSFVKSYGLFRAAFASETPPTPAQLQVVWGFLRDESIEPSVFLRMRERYPERTQDVMRLVLKDRLFRLDEDFEPTLRKFKGRAMRKPPKAALSLVAAADIPAFRERQQRREAEAARASG